LKRVQSFRESLSGCGAEATTPGGQGETIPAGTGLDAVTGFDNGTVLEPTAVAVGAGSGGRELSAVQPIASNRDAVTDLSFTLNTS